MRKKIGLVAAIMLIATTAAAQDPIDRIVKDDELSGVYSGNEKSNHVLNREYAITNPVGNAQTAIGTRFERGGDRFQVMNIVEEKETYQVIAGGSYERVIYRAKGLVEPVCEKPLEPIGPELTVVVDYRPAVGPQYFEPYIAEVQKGEASVAVDRWEYSRADGRSNR